MDTELAGHRLDTASALHRKAGVAVTSIGVDTGGTHTDLVLYHQGEVITLKVPTTPHDLNDGILAGVEEITRAADITLDQVARFVYASTFVTNLIVEGKQAHVGLVTTAGFRDVLEIGRASRKPDVYDIHWRPAAPLVPRHRRHGVRERINHAGEVLVPLDEDDVRRALAELAQAKVRSIAVCLFHAYANPAHERRIAELAQEICPEIDVSLSSDVVREFREYERSSTTCVNAFIKRPIVDHLTALRHTLSTRGMAAGSFIMQGNGGLTKFEQAATQPTAITHSGIMGGIVGATTLALRCGIKNIITLDMGGTSADVALVSDGKPLLTYNSTVGAYPLLIPTLDMVTIGAGGGSIAWIDGGTALRVGPHSAGSVPGPACYGTGGANTTVTDANLITGRLNGEFFLAGKRALHLDRAAAVTQETIADPLGMDLETAALGVLSIAEANMANAIRLVSVDRGLDPRDFTLVAFGGAGGLHAVRLAQALSIRRILIPPAPGNLSAMGLLSADIRHDFSRTLVAVLDVALVPEIERILQELTAEAGAALAGDGIAPDGGACTVSLDLRYRGQNYELSVPLTAADLDADFDALRERFHELHARMYGYRLQGREVQLVNVRVTAIGIVDTAQWPRRPEPAGKAAPVGRRAVYVEEGRWVQAEVYRHVDLGPGHGMQGPAIVEYPGSTLFVDEGWSAEFDATMNAHLRLRDGDAS